MAKRRQRTLARKETALKRGKVRTKVKSAPRKAAERAGSKTRARKTAKRVPVKTKAEKQAIKGRAKRAAPKKAAPRPTEPLRQPAEAPDETVIVDIVEEPVRGVVVVTEFESVRTSRPETLTLEPESEEGSSLAQAD
jgi:hypothetical protein